MTDATAIAELSSKVDQLLAVSAGRWPKWLGVKTTAEYADVSEPTVRRWISAGKIQPRRPAKGKLLIDRIELDTFIASCTTKPRTGRGRNNGRRNGRTKKRGE